MSLNRWIIFIAALVIIGWLHFVYVEPQPEQLAVRSTVNQLQFIGDDLIAVSGAAGKLSIWTYSNRRDPRVFSSLWGADAWSQDQNAVVFYQGHTLRVYDLETDEETLFVELRNDSATILNYSHSTQEVIAETHIGLQAFDIEDLAESNEFRADSRLLYPTTSNRLSSRRPSPPDLSLLPGPHGSFAFYDNGNGELWGYFPGPDENPRKVDDLSKVPDILWANDGGSFSYRPSGESRVHVVNRTHHYEWPSPAPGPDGLPQVEQLTKDAVLVNDGNRVHFHNIANGSRTRTIEYAPLHSQLPADISTGVSSQNCRPAASNNLQFLMLNCEFGQVGVASVTNLSTMKMDQFKRYDVIADEAAQMSISDTGASAFAYARTVQFIAAGSTKPKFLVGPLNRKESDSQLLWGVYRIFVLMIAISMAVSMNKLNNRLASEDDYATAGFGLFFAVKSTMFIVIFPGALLFTWFALRVFAGKEPHFGGMYPGISLILVGLGLVVGAGIIGAVAASAAAVSSAIARVSGARPADVALIAPISVYAALLVASYWF